MVIAKGSVGHGHRVTDHPGQLGLISDGPSEGFYGYQSWVVLWANVGCFMGERGVRRWAGAWGGGVSG